MNALLLTAIMGVIMMFCSFLLKKKAAVRWVAHAGMLIILVANIAETYWGMRLFSIDTGGMMDFNRLPLFAITIVYSCTFIFLLLSSKEMEKVGVDLAEYLALIFFILAGIALVVSFTSLLILFLGIEIISIPLYILTGSDKRNLKSNEASLKYFLLGAFSTGLMLMGITLLYGSAGTFDVAGLIGDATKVDTLSVMGMMLILFSMSFKVSVVPFHFWTPDVYDGAPTVFTSFMATIVKAAVFIGFIRLFNNAFGQIQATWQFLAAVLVAITLVIGNITAVFQQSVKRMLAYSSISQAGFMMMALFALNTSATEGLLLYAAAYCLATIGVFAVLMKMKDYAFEGFNGFARHHPVLAATNTIFLLSLAGIPLTAGFLSKFYMLKAAVETGHYLWLVILAVLMAAVSVYYYFRVIQAMYFKEGEAPSLSITPGFKWGLVVLAALVILLGVFPDILLYWFYF